MIDTDIIFEEIKFSLGELQYMYSIEKNKEYKNWLEKRIQHLRDHPNQQIKLGIISVEDMKYKRKRVDGLKKIKLRIEEKKLLNN